MIHHCIEPRANHTIVLVSRYLKCSTSGIYIFTGYHKYDAQRTVTWEHDTLGLSGFPEHVLRSLRNPLIGLTRNLIFAGKVPFS